MNTYTDEYLGAMHRRSLQNREAILAAEQVGCFECCEIFPASEVTHFTVNGQSADAWCPKCGIDSIIANDGVNEFSPELIKALNERYFGVPDESLEPNPSQKTYSSFTELMADYDRRKK